jgi:hypothetical protein
MSKKNSKGVIGLKNLFKKRGILNDQFMKNTSFKVDQEYNFSDFKVTTTKFGEAIVSLILAKNNNSIKTYNFSLSLFSELSCGWLFLVHLTEKIQRRLEDHRYKRY